jgi:hypothetical protein
MQKSGIISLKRTGAYSVGIALFIFGAVGLGIDLEMMRAASSDFFSFVMSAICIASGTLICVATRLQYGGGFWFVFGVISASVALIATAALFAVYLKGEHLQDSITSYSRIGAVWVIGLFCLVMGHIAHRKKRNSEPTVQEPTATATKKSKKVRIVVLIGILFAIFFVVIFLPLLGRAWRKNHPVNYASVVPANKWKRFASDEGGFSIRFPGTPEETNVLVKVAAGEFEMPCYFVWADVQTEYAVNYVDYPRNVDKLGTEKIFDLSMASVAGAFGKIVFYRDMSFKGYPAREFEFVAGGRANFSGRVRLILVHQRLYQILVIFLTQNPHRDDFRVFFESLSLRQDGHEGLTLTDRVLVMTAATMIISSQSPR